MHVSVDERAGPRIKKFLEQRPPNCAEIAREGAFSRQYAWRVLAGRERPSAKFIEACERLGVPVLAILSEGEDRAA